MKDLYIEKQDYKYLSWNKIRSSSGTAGSFLKATETIKGKKVYYKLSNYNSVNGIVGHECINELIVSRLLDILEIEHLNYRLLYGEVMIDNKIYETYFCCSDNFRKQEERKMTFEDIFQMQKIENEAPFEFAVRKGWKKEICNMILVDFLILNRDRHGANLEIIMDKNGNERMAPLFDHGISLMFNCLTDKEIDVYDVLEDKNVQSFIGGRSTKENLKLLSTEYYENLPKLTMQDRDYILSGLNNILSDKHLDKIWKMIWKRWKYYEDMFSV